MAFLDLQAFSADSERTQRLAPSPMRRLLPLLFTLTQMISPFDLERSGSLVQTSWLDAHNQADDYSSTLGGVHKTKEQKVIKFLHCVSSSF